MMMTPYKLEIFLHLYYSPAKIENRGDWRKVADAFLEDGVLERSDNNENGYRTTDMGKAWLKTMLSTPLPRQVYIDQMDNIIIY